MPQYKLKEGKLVRKAEKGGRESFIKGDVVDMSVEQAKNFGLNLLERQHADEQEGGEQEQEPQLTTNPAGGKKTAHKATHKQTEPKE
jgi:hypothetical protein